MCFVFSVLLCDLLNINVHVCHNFAAKVVWNPNVTNDPALLACSFITASVLCVVLRCTRTKTENNWSGVTGYPFPGVMFIFYIGFVKYSVFIDFSKNPPHRKYCFITIMFPLSVIFHAELYFGGFKLFCHGRNVVHIFLQMNPRNPTRILGFNFHIPPPLKSCFCQFPFSWQLSDIWQDLHIHWLCYYGWETKYLCYPCSLAGNSNSGSWAMDLKLHRWHELPERGIALYIFSVNFGGLFTSLAWSTYRMD